MPIILKTLLLTACFIILSPFAKANAGTFRPATETRELAMGCTLVYEGQIKDGDAKAFKAQIAERTQQVLCLDSPGGDIFEAIKISELMVSPIYFLSTAIPQKGRCESACAIIFMFGKIVSNLGGQAESYGTDRRLHIDGKLGFHSPDIDFNQDVLYKAEAMKQVFSIGTLAISEIIRIRERMPWPGFDDLLLQDMLKTPSTDMYYVQTVGDAARMGIQLFGAATPAEKKEVFTSICANAREVMTRDRNWNKDWWDDDYNLIGNYNARVELDFFFKGLGRAGRCEIEMSKRGDFVDEEANENILRNLYATVSMNMPSRSYTSTNEIKEISFFSPPDAFLYPPITKFKDILPAKDYRNSVSVNFSPGEYMQFITGKQKNYPKPNWCPNAKTAVEKTICSSEKLSQKDLKINDLYKNRKSDQRIKKLVTANLKLRNACGSNVECIRKISDETITLLSRPTQKKSLLSCGIKKPRATITNVQNYTNLRQQAGLNGPVISQVPVNATASVVNPGAFLRYDRCAAACNGTNQNAIKQCIDNNDVWIEVQYNGRKGFLSRKFLN